MQSSIWLSISLRVNLPYPVKKSLADEVLFLWLKKYRQLVTVFSVKWSFTELESSLLFLALSFQK